MQIPNLPNYIQVPQQQPVYNAVKIDINNPTVNAPGQQPVQQPIQQSNVTSPIVPMYDYPQAPIYAYPQAPVQPYYMPPSIQTPVAQQEPTIVTMTPPTQAPSVPDHEPVIVQMPQTVAVPPAPQITEEIKEEVKEEVPEKKPETPVAQAPAEEAPAAAPAPEAPVEVVPPTPITPQVDLNAFLAKLTNPDFDVQMTGMEDIAAMVNSDPKKATELLDTKIVDALTNIVNTDTSATSGLAEDQVEKANRNKCLAMYSAAILQKLYGEEVQKMTNSTVPLTELPGAVTIVEQLKNNEHPMVRSSAIEALSYIQAPAYKKDLTTIFTIAQKDVDPNVKEAAAAALDKLNQIPDEDQHISVDMTPQQEEVKTAA